MLLGVISQHIFYLAALFIVRLKLTQIKSGGQTEAHSNRQAAS